VPGKHSNRSRIFWARGFASLSTLLALLDAFSDQPAEAAPFAFRLGDGTPTMSR
jgi:hypothetical protein